MRPTRKFAAALALSAVCATGAVSASAQSSSGVQHAEAIRKLDIMLMVTSLRCRTGEHDFQADYHRFAAAHLDRLNDAGEQLRRSLVARHGHKGSNRALDKMGVTMANSYGGGHPWLDCAGLKRVTQELGATRDDAMLSDAAVRLLAPQPMAERELAPPHLPVAPIIAQADPVRPQVTPRETRRPYDLGPRREVVSSREVE